MFDFKKWLAFPSTEYENAWYVCPIEYYLINGYIKDGLAFASHKFVDFEEISDHIVRSTTEQETGVILKHYGFLCFDTEPFRKA
jgi:hypothetical protein